MLRTRRNAQRTADGADESTNKRLKGNKDEMAVDQAEKAKDEPAKTKSKKGNTEAMKAKAEAEEKAKADAAKAKADAEKAKADAEKAKADAEKAKADAEKAKAEADEKAKAEANTKAKPKSKAKAKAAAEAEAEAEAKAAAEAEAEAEAKAKAEAAEAEAEAEAKAKAAAEAAKPKSKAKAKAAAEAAEAKAKAAAEAAEAEAKAKAAAEAAEAKAKAAAEAAEAAEAEEKQLTDAEEDDNQSVTSETGTRRKRHQEIIKSILSKENILCKEMVLATDVIVKTKSIPISPVEGTVITAKQLHTFYTLYKKYQKSIPFDSEYEILLAMGQQRGLMPDEDALSMLEKLANTSKSSEYVIGIGQIGTTGSIGETLTKTYPDATGIICAHVTKTGDKTYARVPLEAIMINDMLILNAEEKKEENVKLQVELKCFENMPAEFSAQLQNILTLETDTVDRNRIEILKDDVGCLESIDDHKARIAKLAVKMKDLYRMALRISVFFVPRCIPSHLFRFLGVPSFNRNKVSYYEGQLSQLKQDLPGFVADSNLPFANALRMTKQSKIEQRGKQLMVGELKPTNKICESIRDDFKSAESKIQLKVDQATEKAREGVFFGTIARKIRDIRDEGEKFYKIFDSIEKIIKEKPENVSSEEKKNDESIVGRIAHVIPKLEIFMNTTERCMNKLLKHDESNLQEIQRNIEDVWNDIYKLLFRITIVSEKWRESTSIDQSRKIAKLIEELKEEIANPDKNDRKREFESIFNNMALVVIPSASSISLHYEGAKYQWKYTGTHPMNTYVIEMFESFPAESVRVVLAMADLVSHALINTLDAELTDDKVDEKLVEECINKRDLAFKGLRLKKDENDVNETDYAQFKRFFTHYSAQLETIKEELFKICPCRTACAAILAAVRNPKPYEEQVLRRLRRAYEDDEDKLVSAFQPKIVATRNKSALETLAPRVKRLVSDMIMHGLFVFEKELVQKAKEDPKMPNVFKVYYMLKKLTVHSKDRLPRQALEMVDKAELDQNHNPDAIIQTMRKYASKTSISALVTDVLIPKKDGSGDAEYMWTAFGLTKMGFGDILSASKYAETDFAAKILDMQQTNLLPVHKYNIIMEKVPRATSNLMDVVYGILQQLVKGSPEFCKRIGSVTNIQLLYASLLDAITASMVWLGTRKSDLNQFFTPSYLDPELIDVPSHIYRQAGITKDSLNLFWAGLLNEERPLVKMLTLALCAGSPDNRAWNELTERNRPSKKSKVSEDGASADDNLFRFAVPKLFCIKGSKLEPLDTVRFGFYKKIVVTLPDRFDFATAKD